MVTHQIAFPVAVVDKVTSVSLAGVGKSEALPVLFTRGIVTHQGGQVFYVDVVRVEAGRRAESHLESLHQLVEAVDGDAWLKTESGVDSSDDFGGHGQRGF